MRDVTGFANLGAVDFDLSFVSRHCFLFGLSMVKSKSWAFGLRPRAL